MLKIDAKRVREVLDYDPATGKFTWRKSVGSVSAGRKAGTVRNSDGYTYISIDGVVYKAARLAWAYMTGENPSQQIDHANRDRSDDSWGNLRLADKSQNGANTPRPRNNTSGYKGASRDRKRWRAQITHRGRKKYLGAFDTAEQAHAAYMRAAEQLHGKFAHGGAQ